MKVFHLEEIIHILVFILISHLTNLTIFFFDNIAIEIRNDLICSKKGITKNMLIFLVKFLGAS